MLAVIFPIFNILMYVEVYGIRTGVFLDPKSVFFDPIRDSFWPGSVFLDPILA